MTVWQPIEISPGLWAVTDGTTTSEETWRTLARATFAATKRNLPRGSVK